MVMIRKLFFLQISLTLLISCSLAVQLPDSLKNLQMAPFYYGVASGDPTSDHVIIWTHVTPVSAGSAQVDWQVATDTSFLNIISSGSVTTDTGSDYTVKVDAGGLQPNSWYYYRFQYNGQYSITGRTRTMPDGNVNQLRAALFTCADYKDGYFNAYGRIVDRNDVDFVIHHGDYIYESSSDANNVRQVYSTANKCVSVDDFRTRYAVYHSEPQLVAACQQYPWFCIWDDHEFRNDAWHDGAVNLSGQSWIGLEANALKVYYEWMPTRFPDPSDSVRIWRKYSLGPLADLVLLDARIYGRDSTLSLNDPGTNDSLRTILGLTQRQWLLDQLDSSTAQWKIVSQQVVMAPFSLLGNPAPSSEKAWNGFPYERKFILDHILDNNQNVVVTTGDLHASVASDLPPDVSQYNANTGQGSAAVEFVTPSLTSGGDFAIPYTVLKPSNPFLSFGDLTNRGYSVLDMRPDTVFCSYYFTPYTTYSTQESFEGCRYTSKNKSHLQDCGGEARSLSDNPALTPSAPGNILSVPLLEAGGFSVYPNPTSGNLFIENNDPGPAGFEIRNMNGQVISGGVLKKGENVFNLNEKNLSGGIYIIEIKSGGKVYSKKIVLL